MMTEQTEREPKDPEQAFEWLEAAPYHPQHFSTMAAYKSALDEWDEKIRAGRMYLFRHAAHGLACEGMMARAEALNAMIDAIADERVLGFAGVLGMTVPGSLAPMQAVIAYLRGQARHELALLENAERQAAAEAEGEGADG